MKDGNLTILYTKEARSSCTLLCIHRAAEHTEQQSSRAAEQTAAEQSAGHMTRALLSRDGPCASAQTSVWAL
jgi:hypothetical protein